MFAPPAQLKRKGQKQNTQSIPMNAPVKGIIANALYGENAEVGAEGAIWLYNLIPSEYGCRIRKGSQEFAINLPDNASPDKGQVRTLMLYNSVQAGGAQDYYFACTSSGIYNITGGGSGAWIAEEMDGGNGWPVQGGDAGWCSYVNYTNVNGDHFLLVCDEENGYWIFNGTSWAQGTFTGSPKPDPTKLVHIIEWQARIWFVEKNSARAWYLDPLALTGDITPFDVGSRFKKGGHLVQNTTWTLDDGAGMDDKFVQVSSSGDVLVWTGTNPDVQGGIALQGRWYVGKVPEGRRVMSQYGGDVSILCKSGIIMLSTILQGGTDVRQDQYITNNISRLMRVELEKTSEEYGWSFELNPREGTAIISVPNPVSEATRAPIQFVYNIPTQAWCMYRDLDMACMNDSVDGFYFGTNDGRVMEHTGFVDDAPILGGEGASVISFSLLTHYTHLGSPATWKRPQFARPSWIGEAQPVYTLQMRYDFDLGEVLTSPPYLNAGIALWDNAIWDLDEWSGTAQSYYETNGVRGMGRHLAIAIRGTSSVAVSYLGCDLMLEGGGLL